MIIPCGSFQLRSFQPGDVDSMARYANNFNIWLNLRNSFPYPYSPADAAAFIGVCRHQQPPSNLCIDLNGECVGVVGFIPQPDVYRKTADLGYWLGEPFWGKGIMTTAVKKTTEYIFEQFDIIRIFAGVFSWNPASMNVLKKAGFTEECVFRKSIFKNGHILNEHRFCLLRDKE
ncbi:GNAT family protein [Paraflavisolibacter sp. H34]|uniref:GNAT family N-acetyltransferase n=1 Tax=Huijunlia imazamoxiresistens TaxID=3127457 RepID=UPI003015CACA